VHSTAELPTPLQASLPQICEQILVPVDPPPVTADSDARLAWEAGDDALFVANERIRAGHACVRDQREAYAGQGAKP